MMKKFEVVSAVLAGLLTLAQLIRSFYGVTGVGLGRAALILAGISLFLLLLRSKWFHRQTLRVRLAVAMGTVIGLTVAGAGIDHAAAKLLPKPPHVHVKNISLQPLIVGQPIRWLIYLQSVGGSGTIELVDDSAISDHRSQNTDHQAISETFYFTRSRQKFSDSRFPKFYLDISTGDTYTLTVQSDPLTQYNLDVLQAGGVIYLTGLVGYVGKPDLPPAEFCAFWVKETLHSAGHCHDHNSD